MILKELFIKLGLDVDAQSFAKGQLAANTLTGVLQKVVEVGRDAIGGLNDALIGFNARAEASRMGLAGIAGMNLKLPWEEAKKAADALYAGLQEDAAKTPAETAELVEFSQQIAGAYLSAGKNMNDLRQFTTQAVVAAKMLKAEGTAATDIKQAIQGRVSIKDMFAANIIKSLDMSIEEFNKKSMQERADLFAKGLNNPTIRAAMDDYENQWDGVTSTIKDNISIIMGEIGKPLFGFLKKVLKGIGDWIQKNKGPIIGFFDSISATFEFLSKNAIALEIILGAAGLYKTVNLLATAMGGLSVASVKAALATARAWLAAAAPFLAIGAIIGGFLLVFDDIRVYLKGGDSLYGRFKKEIDEWTKPNPKDPWWLSAIKEMVKGLQQAVELMRDVNQFVGGSQYTEKKFKEKHPEQFNEHGNYVGRQDITFVNGKQVKLRRGGMKVGDFGQLKASGAPLAAVPRVRVPEYRASSPSMVSPAAASGVTGGDTHVTIGPNYQQPGEDMESFTSRIAEKVVQAKIDAAVPAVSR